jgi:hypothetical protein
VSRNRRSEVFTYKKAYEGVTHSSVGRLGGYTHRVRSRAPSGNHQKPPERSLSDCLGARGLLSGTNFMVPEEGELMVPNDQNRTDD